MAKYLEFIKDHSGVRIRPCKSRKYKSGDKAYLPSFIADDLIAKGYAKVIDDTTERAPSDRGTPPNAS